MSTFEVKKSSDGQFYFRLKSGNGEIILASEMYTTHAAALKGIQSVKKNASNATLYELKTSAKKQPFFVLKAGNHEVIGTSEMYSSESARDNGVASVKTNAPDAEIVDQTTK